MSCKNVQATGVSIEVAIGKSVIVVCSTFGAVTAEDILNIDSTYTGAHLMATSLQQVCMYI